MKRALWLVFATVIASAQSPIDVNPVLSSESDGLFNAAGETSTVINLRLVGGLPAKEFAVQAFATPGTAACTYSVKGAIPNDSGALAPETLDETDFATHAEWDVTGGFVDSGGNAVYTFTPLEVLTELDFATHANWAVTTGFVDSGGDAAYTHAPLEVLTELDFATHANWDVTGGFVDSGGNAIYLHTPLEVLSELDFATHVNWAAAGDMTDSTGAAVYTHSGGTGTLTQAAVGFANAAVNDAAYTFSYTVSSFSGDVACDITTAIASATTALTMSDGAQTTTFTAASSTGDFIISCTSGSGGVTIDDVTLTRVDHTATLTQESGDFANAGVNSVGYVFGYTVSSTTGTPLCDITTAFADSTTALTISDGAQTTTFTSASSTGHFIISCASNAVGETTTFDDVTLKRADHTATLTQASGSFANAMVASVGYTFNYTISSTTGTPVCEITTAIASSATALTETDGTQATTFTSAAVPGDFIISCTSDAVGETTTFDDVTLKRVNHTATLTQVEADLALTPAINAVPYTFDYTVSAPTGDTTCIVTTAFAASAVNLLETAGTHTAKFTSAASAGDFVISCTNTSGGITFDDVSLKRTIPSGSDFVDLPTPAALSCLAANDERLHFFANRGVQSLEISLVTLTGGPVVFRVLGR